MIKYAYRLETKRIREKDFPYNNEDLCSAERVFEFCRTLQDLDIEKLITLYLNGLNRLICIQLFTGTVNFAVAYPREIIKHALLSGACGVILAHNHPSGDLSPSEEDIKLTSRLKEAGELLGIEVLDHVIVADKGFISMRERKLL